VKEVLQDLNDAFTNRYRLGIMSALMVNDFVDFNTLKELLDMKDGNLASHTKALESLNYITIEKSFVGKKTNTKYRVTAQGRKAFEQHLEALEKLVMSTTGLHPPEKNYNGD
jgi:DNA-binding MarR family transcriptional regulator